MPGVRSGWGAKDAERRQKVGGALAEGHPRVGYRPRGRLHDEELVLQSFLSLPKPTIPTSLITTVIAARLYGIEMNTSGCFFHVKSFLDKYDAINNDREKGGVYDVWLRPRL